MSSSSTLTSSSSTSTTSTSSTDSVRRITSEQLYELDTGQWSKERFKSDQLTLVTALFDISKNENRDNVRTTDKYLQLGKHLLELPINIVIATESHLASEIWRYRRDIGMADKTFVYTVDLENSPYYKYLNNIQELFKVGNKPDGTSQSKDSPLYLIVTWTRYWILQQITKMNPFNSKGLVWLDYGIFHLYTNQLLATKNKIIEIMGHIPTNKIKLMLLCETSDNEIKDTKAYYSKRQCKLAGGFCSGSIDDINWLADQFEKELKLCLELGYPALDEPIMSIIYRQNPSRFMPYYGDYQQCITNNINMTDGFWIIIRNLDHCRAHTYIYLLSIL